MKKVSARAWRQAASCLSCAIVGWILSDTYELGPSEFSGGTVTGPLLTLHDISGDLFIVAVLLTFMYRRVAAAIALSACVLALPMYLFFTVPGVFRMSFRGQWKALPSANVVWNTWAAAGIVALATAAYVCLRAPGATLETSAGNRE